MAEGVVKGLSWRWGWAWLQQHARVLANDKGNFTTFKFNLPGVAIKQEAGSK